jgi:thioredoxin-dependent peroxiredoxin
VKEFGYLYYLQKLYKNQFFSDMTHLKEGDMAPDFSLSDQNGVQRSLKDYKGAKLAIYFYPKDDTPGCTAQACNLRDNYAELRQKGFNILGVSADSEAKHQKFIEKYSLPFSLLADTEKRMCNDYGVWGEKKFMGKSYMGISRTTFVINENGTIEKIITKVETKDHASQIF